MISCICPQTFITFYVGINVAEEVSNDFSHTIAPFLMGSVALGMSNIFKLSDFSELPSSNVPLLGVVVCATSVTFFFIPYFVILLTWCIASSLLENKYDSSVW